MSKLKWLEKWLEYKRQKRVTEYEDIKRKFEKIIGRSSITITVGLPEGMEALREEFLCLEKDEEFLEAVERLAEKRLKRRAAE